MRRRFLAAIGRVRCRMYGHPPRAVKPTQFDRGGRPLGVCGRCGASVSLFNGKWY